MMINLAIVSSVIFKQQIGCCNWEREVDSNLFLARRYLLRLYFLPEAPVVFHFCQVNPLLVINVDVNFIDDLISLKAILRDLDLFNHVS